jgi:hypothetical protein
LRYIDSGSRDPKETLAAWLQAELTHAVTELRWQSGYYSADGLSPFVTTIARLSNNNQPIHAIIGSNDGETVLAHVVDLANLLRLPRSNAKLGVVSFSNGLYHPKTYHFRREDGSQAAYVGSANLSLFGVGSQNIEAGLIVDTRDGDPAPTLDAIADSVDDWFNPVRAGLESVADAQDANRLEQQGILAAAPVPRPPRNVAGANVAAAQRPALQLLVPMPRRPGIGGGQVVARAPGPPVPPVLPAVPQAQFPPYVLFAPGQNTPTVGVTALSGATLPGGYVGLVVQLNRDATRLWRGEPGTANISIPVPSVSTLRFGMFQARYTRPRAEFTQVMRYIHAGGIITSPPNETNVMVYGFAPGETGHGDVRLVVTRPPALYLSAQIQALGLPLPQAGDVALLDWPTTQDPRMRLTFLERGSPLFNQSTVIFAAAQAAGQLVGRGACWLQAGLAPPW